MAALTNTELAATIDEVWDMTVLQARYEDSQIMARILNKSDLVKKSGDIIHIPIKKKKVVGNVTASTGAFTPDAQTLSQVDVTVDTWKYVSDETTDQAEAASYWSPESDFPKDAGAALAEVYDQSISGLYTDITTNVIGNDANPGEFTDDEIRGAMLKLRNLKIPLSNLSFILPPRAFYMGLFAQDRFTDADRAGLPKNVLTTNFRFPLLGVPAYETTELRVAGAGNAYKAFLLHKEAFAIAMQINNKFKRAEATAASKLSTIVVMNSLYGVKTVRENHAVLINVKSAD